jgi:hypothetical protein
MQHFLNPARIDFLEIFPQEVRIHFPNMVTDGFISFPLGVRAWFLSRSESL